MANKRIKDLTDTITSFRTGDVIPVDGPSGTAKMSKDDLLRVTSENAVDSGVAGSVSQLGRALTDVAKLTRGTCYSYDGHSLSLISSTSWSSIVIEESEFFKASLIGNSASASPTNIPPIVLLDGPDPLTANIIDVVYGDEVVPGYNSFRRFSGTYSIHGRTTYVLLQSLRLGEFANTIFYQKSSDNILDEVRQITNPIESRMLVIDNKYEYNFKKSATVYNAALKKFRLEVDNGTLSLKGNTNWNYYVFPASGATHVKASGTDSSGKYPPVVFLSNPIIQQDNFVSCLYSDAGQTSFDKDVTIPEGAKFIAINAIVSSLGGGLGVTYKKAKWRDCIIVDQEGGGDYTTLTDAVADCAGGETIYVRPGVYDGSLRLWNLHDIKIIGEDKNSCIIQNNNGLYENPPIEMVTGVLENLTIRANYVSGVSQDVDSSTSGAYALHIEKDDSNFLYANGKSLEIRNCVLQSDFFPAIGCGALPNWTLRIEDCELINSQITGRGTYTTGDQETLGAFYVHDSNAITIARAKIIVKNCVIKTLNFKNAVCMYDRSFADGRGNDFLFFGNVLSGDEGQSGNIWWRSAGAFAGDFTNDPASFGNSNPQLNA